MSLIIHVVPFNNICGLIAQGIYAQLARFLAFYFIENRYNNVAEALHVSYNFIYTTKFDENCTEASKEVCLARSTVNRKVGGSSPPGNGTFFLLCFIVFYCFSSSI